MATEQKPTIKFHRPHTVAKPVYKPIPKPQQKPVIGQKPLPPVTLPAHIPQNDWVPWWRKNRHYYGDRDYYLSMGYPLWWVDLYYPWDPVYVISQPQIQQQALPESVLPQNLTVNFNWLTVFMIGGSGFFVLFLIIMFLFKK